jgi:hypothetical protein
MPTPDHLTLRLRPFDRRSSAELAALVLRELAPRPPSRDLAPTLADAGLSRADRRVLSFRERYPFGAEQLGDHLQAVFIVGQDGAILPLPCPAFHIAHRADGALLVVEPHTAAGPPALAGAAAATDLGGGGPPLLVGFILGGIPGQLQAQVGGELAGQLAADLRGELPGCRVDRRRLVLALVGGQRRPRASGPTRRAAASWATSSSMAAARTRRSPAASRSASARVRRAPAGGTTRSRVAALPAQPSAAAQRRHGSPSTSRPAAWTRGDGWRCRRA